MVSFRLAVNAAKRNKRETESGWTGRMNAVLFSVGDFAVSGWALALAAAIVAGLGLAALIVGHFRRERTHLMALAEATATSVQSGLREQIADRDRRLRELRDELAMQIEANGDLRARSAALEAQMGEQAANLERFVAARQQMTDEFKALAGDVLKSHGETFSRQNREQVDLLLKPLGEKIVEFQTGLVRERAELGQRIRTLAETGLAMSREANALTQALKGNAQAQGAWGEMILTSILEKSGLREGEQFRTQESHATDMGGRVRTDVEVLLPDGDCLIIDSKVSLTAFEACVNAEDDAERQQQLRAHVASMRSHIRTLSGKDYQRHAGSGLDFVFMFVPIEAAFAAALTAEPRLIEEAIAQGVMITTPTTLLSALRTVRNVWDMEKRQRNAEEIAARAGLLYDKVALFLESMDKLGTSLERARGVFNDARSQLAGGQGSVVRQIEMLRELGAKSRKQIGSGWTEGEAAVVSLADRRGE
jgi:DNA recombination protein RmuC